MQIGKWTDSKEHKDDKNRVLNYTLHLKSKLGPKTSVTKEEQILNHRSKCGKYFLMDTFIYNSGFPLADCFHTANRYCLVNAGPNKTKMRVFSHVIFDKPVFFGSKSLIETTSKSGLADYFDELVAVINNEVKSSVSPSLTKKPDGKKTHEPVSDDVLKDYTWNIGIQKERAWLILIVLSLIICLSFFYLRFRKLEDMTDEQIRHKWKELVDKSNDLDQMKQLLVKIKTKIDKMLQQNPVNLSVSPQSTMSNAKSAKESFLEFLNKVISRKDLIPDVVKS